MGSMNNFTGDDFLKLKELFFGELQQSQTTWLVPVQKPFIDIDGKNVEKENDSFQMDLGPISALETVNRSVLVSNLTQQPLLAWVVENDDYISAQWENNSSETFMECGGGQCRLDLSLYSDVPEARDLSKTVRIMAEMESGVRKEVELSIKGKTLVDFPYVKPGFNGNDTSRPHDFGKIDPSKGEKKQYKAYSLFIGNDGNKHLTVIFGDIPGWLRVDSGEYHISGKRTEFKVGPKDQIVIDFYPRPALDFLGKNSADVQFETNDTRPSFKKIVLPFSLEQEIPGAYVTLEETPALEVTPKGIHEFNIRLLNWGKEAAKVSVQGNDMFNVVEDAVVPMYAEQEPGKIELPVQLVCEGLVPGKCRHQLALCVGAAQDTLAVPVDILVVEAETPVGKVCPRCSMISGPELPYCGLCGEKTRDAKPIFKDDVLYCPACERKYASSIEFCPEDGKKLLKLP